MVYENLRSAKVSKSFPRRALTGKLIEDTFLHFEIKKMGFTCMFTGKITKDSLFSKSF